MEEGIKSNRSKDKRAWSTLWAQDLHQLPMPIWQQAWPRARIKPGGKEENFKGRKKIKVHRHTINKIIFLKKQFKPNVLRRNIFNNHVTKALCTEHYRYFMESKSSHLTKQSRHAGNINIEPNRNIPLDWEVPHQAVGWVYQGHPTYLYAIYITELPQLLCPAQ